MPSAEQQSMAMLSLRDYDQAVGNTQPDVSVRVTAANDTLLEGAHPQSFPLFASSKLDCFSSSTVCVSLPRAFLAASLSGLFALVTN